MDFTKGNVTMAKRKSKAGARWFITLSGLVWVLLLLGSFWLFKRNYDFLSTSLTATGQVIDMESSTKNRPASGLAVYHPVVRFEMEDGTEVIYRSRTGSNPATHRVGEEVKVHYRYDNPQQAKIDSFTDLWLWPSVMLVAGALLCALWAFLFKALRNSKWI